MKRACLIPNLFRTLYTKLTETLSVTIYNEQAFYTNKKKVKNHIITFTSYFIHCIFDTSNFVLMISSSESSSGSVLVGMFSSTQRRSESRELVLGSGRVESLYSCTLLSPLPDRPGPRILTPYASFTNCSSSSEIINAIVFMINVYLHKSSKQNLVHF